MIIKFCMGACFPESWEGVFETHVYAVSTVLRSGHLRLYFIKEGIACKNNTISSMWKKLKLVCSKTDNSLQQNSHTEPVNFNEPGWVILLFRLTTDYILHILFSAFAEHNTTQHSFFNWCTLVLYIPYHTIPYWLYLLKEENVLVNKCKLYYFDGMHACLMQRAWNMCDALSC